jgi:DNA-binding MurR/RpiR family transcriptional regulator
MRIQSQGDLDIGNVIQEHFSQLTKSEIKIAEYILKNQEDVAFIAAGDLANMLELSEATLVRFARTLGFDSYPAMRDMLQDAFRRRVTHSARLRSRLDDLRNVGDIFEKITVTEIDYLTQALQTVDREALDEAVKAILSSKRLFAYGIGPSAILVDLMELRLTRYGKQVIPLKVSGREMLEPLLLMTEKDLLFVIGFFDMNPTLQIVLEHANERKCTVILLTDTLGSIIGDKADIVLSAKRGPVSAFHSLVVPMTIVNTILLEVADQSKESVIPNLDKLDQLRERLTNFKNS